MATTETTTAAAPAATTPPSTTTTPPPPTASTTSILHPSTPPVGTTATTTTTTTTDPIKSPTTTIHSPVTTTSTLTPTAASTSPAPPSLSRTSTRSSSGGKPPPLDLNHDLNDNSDAFSDLGTPLGFHDGAGGFRSESVSHDLNDNTDDAFALHQFLGPTTTGDDDAALRSLHSVRRVDILAKPPRFVSELALLDNASNTLDNNRTSSNASTSSSRSLSTAAAAGVTSDPTALLSPPSDALALVVCSPPPSALLKSSALASQAPKKALFNRLSSAVGYGSSLINAKLKRKQKVIHVNSFCDGCGLEPIVGPLFSCATCSNYDLCSDCYGHGTHGFETSPQLQQLQEALICDKLQRKCRLFTSSFLQSLHCDVCKNRTDKFEYLGNWIADIVIGTPATKIAVRGVEIPALSPAARQAFVSLLMPLVSNRTDVEVHIEWVPDVLEKGDEERERDEETEQVEKLRIWISDKKSRTTSPFA